MWQENTLIDRLLHSSTILLTAFIEPKITYAPWGQAREFVPNALQIA